METERPRLLSRRPMLAAVIPLPRGLVTPPGTKTYFATGLVLRGVFQWERPQAVTAARWHNGDAVAVRAARRSRAEETARAAAQAEGAALRRTACNPLALWPVRLLGVATTHEWD